MSRSVQRRLALFGGPLVAVVLLGVGVAVAASPHTVATTSSSAAAGGPSDATLAAQPAPVADPATDPTTTTAAPATPAPSQAPTTTGPKVTPSTVARAAVPPTTAAPAAPATTAPPAAAPAKLAPGQRLNPSTADLQAAVTALHQRIPLFAPTGPQLLTFADAACAQFDQGRTAAQVQATVQQAVSQVQGASLSAADAQFAVGIVVQLRCPGYLP